jgi:hypothetical protein
MRLVWRRSAPGEFNHELVWLVVSLAVLLAGAIWLGLRFPTLRCPFLAVSGYPCLTCGATRCAIAFLHGNLPAAWHWNPLALIALCGLAIFDVYAAIVLVTGARRLCLMDLSRREKNVARVAIVALIALNWIYLLSHRVQF